jgi:hypothetical protein
MTNITTAQFLHDGTAVTGGTNGILHLWEGNMCTKSVDVHKGHAANHTLRIIDDVVYAGGSDCCLYVLDKTLNKTGEHALKATPRACDKKGNNIIVGLINGDIIEITGTAQKTVMESHSDGEVWGLAINPANPN